MRPSWISYLGIISILLFATQIIGQPDWKLVQKKKDLHVYTKHVEDSNLKKVKIEARIQAPLHEVIAAIEDVEKHKDWVMRTMESEYITIDGPDKFLYYVSSDFPFPAKDRDAVIYYQRWQEPETKIVRTKSHAAPDGIPEKDQFVRIPIFNSTYEFIPADHGNVEITYTLTLSPGGYIPNWIVNFGITAGPIRTMHALFDLVHSGAYKGVQVEGLLE